MYERLFLFPETTETNPSSFLQNAVTTSSRPFKVEGFKLYAFVDRLDEVGYPFCVAPVAAPGKTVSLYQFRFPGKIPDFSEMGCETRPTEHGEVIYLKTKAFIALSAQSRTISVKSGHWNDVANDLHQIAAFAHLDLIPALSHTLLRNFGAINEFLVKFHKLYDVSNTVSTTLAALYSEVLLLLRVFGFASADTYASPDGSSYYFGALREPVAAFHRMCFPSVPVGKCCVTPATVRQLRAMIRYVKAALSRFGYESGEEIHTIVTAINKFQKDQGLKQGACDSVTMRRIWTVLLAGSSDPVTDLSNVGVMVPLENINEFERFGEIDGRGCDEAGRRIAAGLSRAIASLPAPSSILATAQKQLITTARSGAEQFKGVNESVTNLDNRLSSVMHSAVQVQREASNASARAESSLRIIDGLSSLNKEVEEKIVMVRQRMAREVSRTNMLVIVLITLIIALVLQWFSHRHDLKTMIRNGT